MKNSQNTPTVCPVHVYKRSSAATFFICQKIHLNIGAKEGVVPYFSRRTLQYIAFIAFMTSLFSDSSLGVTDCNQNGSELQSAHFPDHIICIYPPPQDHITCLSDGNQRP